MGLLPDERSCPSPWNTTLTRSAHWPNRSNPGRGCRPSPYISLGPPADQINRTEETRFLLYAW